MARKTGTRLIQEGDYLAEVEVELIITDDEWSPYLSVRDAQKLDKVRVALRENDIATAAQFGRVYKLMPVAI